MSNVILLAAGEGTRLRPYTEDRPKCLVELGGQLRASGDEIAITVDRDWLDLWTLRMADPLSDAETLGVCPHGFVQEIGGKPDDLSRIDGQYMGLIRIPAQHNRLVRDSYDEFMPHSERKDMTAFLQFMLDRSVAIRAVEVSRGWLEVDTVEDLAVYRELEERGELSAFWQSSSKQNLWEEA